MDPSKPPVNSPQSFGTASPGSDVKIVANSPRLQLPQYYDDGYESDQERFYRPHVAQRNVSEERTARPPDQGKTISRR